jgi:predicted metal-dependent peptidase
MFMNQNLTPEQRLHKAAVDIMANPKYMALSGVMMIGKRVVSDDVPTACTNGRDEWYGRAFVDSLNDAELRFLVLHEVYHKLFRHLHTWYHLYKEDAKLANAACDYVINVKISDDNSSDKFATMTGPLTRGLLDPKYRGWDSAAVFIDLKKQGKGGGQGQGQSQGQGQGQGQGEGFDEHDWENAQEMNEEEKRELARDIDEAIRQGALVAGKTGTGGDRDFSDLLKVQVDWREVLREFVTSTCAGSDYSTYKRPNRRYLGAGHYFPSGISERVGELVLACDMSGSIGDPEIRVILSEAKGILDTVKPEAVRILYWDTEVCGDERYEMHELDTMIQSTKPKGGGGTDPTCVPAHMQDHNITPQAVIMFTDGYVGNNWGSFNCPVLWVIVDNDRAVPPFGKVVHVKARDLS